MCVRVLFFHSAQSEKRFQDEQIIKDKKRKKEKHFGVCATNQNTEIIIDANNSHQKKQKAKV
jgi:hypothetical protein